MLEMSDKPPADLIDETAHRGPACYGEIRYGSPGSGRMAVALHETGTGHDVYVDADRDRRIETQERVEAHAGIWRVDLRAEIIEDDRTRWAPRTLVFRRSNLSGSLTFAAAGFLEGAVTIGDRRHAARRIDADGNAGFSDPSDRIWIDLNDDGRWDSLSEQFPFTPILRIGDRRFAVRSDPWGERLSFEALTGEGAIKLNVERRETADRVLDITATLVGRDGSAAVVRGLNCDQNMPVGDYRVSSMTVCLKDLGGGTNWNFIFSDNGGRESRRWYPLRKDETLAIDPLASFVATVGVPQKSGPTRPGDILTLGPRLFTSDGLLINSCFRGKERALFGEGPAAKVTLAMPDGTPLASAHSGFA